MSEGEPDDSDKLNGFAYWSRIAYPFVGIEFPFGLELTTGYMNSDFSHYGLIRASMKI